MNMTFCIIKIELFFLMIQFVKKNKYIICIKNLTQDCFNGVQMYGKADGTKYKDDKLVKCAIDHFRNNIKVTLDCRRILANRSSLVVVLELKPWPWRHLQ